MSRIGKAVETEKISSYTGHGGRRGIGSEYLMGMECFSGMINKSLGTLSKVWGGGNLIFEGLA